MFRNSIAGTTDPAKPSLLALPNEIILHHIAGNASLPDDAKTGIMCTLSQTNARLCRLFQAPLAVRAAQCILTNNQGKIEAIVKACPTLLLVPINVTVKITGQTIGPVTPLQLAYGEGAYEVCDMLAQHLASACGSKEAGREEAYRQLDAKFGKEAGEV